MARSLRSLSLLLRPWLRYRSAARRAVAAIGDGLTHQSARVVPLPVPDPRKVSSCPGCLLRLGCPIHPAARPARRAPGRAGHPAGGGRARPAGPAPPMVATATAARAVVLPGRLSAPGSHRRPPPGPPTARPAPRPARRARTAPAPWAAVVPRTGRFPASIRESMITCLLDCSLSLTESRCCCAGSDDTQTMSGQGKIRCKVGPDSARSPRTGQATAAALVEALVTRLHFWRHHAGSSEHPGVTASEPAEAASVNTCTADTRWCQYHPPPRGCCGYSRCWSGRTPTGHVVDVRMHRR
jgi:hypothetical protein